MKTLNVLKVLEDFLTNLYPIFSCFLKKYYTIFNAFTAFYVLYWMVKSRNSGKTRQIITKMVKTIK